MLNAVLLSLFTLIFVLYLDHSFLLVWILCGIWIYHISFAVVSYPDYVLVFMLFSINVRDYRRGNQKNYNPEKLETQTTQYVIDTKQRK